MMNSLSESGKVWELEAREIYASLRLGPASASELRTRLRLSKCAVYAALRTLVEAGWIERSRNRKASGRYEYRIPEGADYHLPLTAIAGTASEVTWGGVRLYPTD